MLEYKVGQLLNQSANDEIATFAVSPNNEVERGFTYKVKKKKDGAPPAGIIEDELWDDGMDMPHISERDEAKLKKWMKELYEIMEMDGKYNNEIC